MEKLYHDDMNTKQFILLYDNAIELCHMYKIEYILYGSIILLIGSSMVHKS